MTKVIVDQGRAGLIQFVPVTIVYPDNVNSAMVTFFVISSGLA